MMKNRHRHPFGLLLLGLSLIAASSVPAHAPPVFLILWGTAGTAEGQFTQPREVAVDAIGNVYFADTNQNRIQKFDSNGAFLQMWGWGVQNGSNTFQTCTSGCRAGIRGAGAGQFSELWGIGVDSTGNIYVADQTNNRIQKFAGSGAFLLMWGWGVQNGSSAFQTCTSGCQAGIAGSGDGQFHSPYGVAVDPTSNVYIADAFNQRIQKFGSGGTYLDKLGTSGTGDGQFSLPSAVAVDAAGNIYVSDTNADRIQKFNSAGIFLAKWGTSGSGDGQFSQPFGLGFDDAGDLYVGDSGNSRIQKFDSNGTFLTKWGTSGSGDGQFALPLGLAISAFGNIYVADKDNHRIQKFGGPWFEGFIAEPETESGR